MPNDPKTTGKVPEWLDTCLSMDFFGLLWVAICLGMFGVMSLALVGCVSMVGWVIG